MFRCCLLLVLNVGSYPSSKMMVMMNTYSLIPHRPYCYHFSSSSWALSLTHVAHPQQQQQQERRKIMMMLLLLYYFSPSSSSMVHSFVSFPLPWVVLTIIVCVSVKYGAISQSLRVVFYFLYYRFVGRSVGWSIFIIPFLISSSVSRSVGRLWLEISLQWWHYRHWVCDCADCKSLRPQTPTVLKKWRNALRRDVNGKWVRVLVSRDEIY